jgi:hypothetical protein
VLAVAVLTLVAAVAAMVAAAVVVGYALDVWW